MALSLGSLNVVLRADSRQFTARLRAAQEQVRDWSRRVDSSTSRTARQFRRLRSQATFLGRSINKAASNFTRLVNKLRAVAFIAGVVAAGIAAIADEVAQLAAAAAGVFVDVQLEAIRARMRSLGLTTDEVTGQVTRFADVADRAGVNIFSVADGMGEFTAAFEAAGGSVDAAAGIVEGFATKASELGVASQEVNAIFLSLTEALREGEVTMEDLRDAVSFTNDPVQTLADAFGTTTARIKGLIESGAGLQRSRIFELADHLQDTADASDSLSSMFNRLVGALTDLIREFNRAGVIDAIKDQFQELIDLFRTDRATAFVQRFADATTKLISETLPNLVQTTVQSWDTIKTVIMTTIGAMIGLAAGGLPGGIIGALIGATGQLGNAFGLLVDTIKGVNTVGSFLIDTFIKPLLRLLKPVKDLVVVLGKELGKLIAKLQVGPADLEGKLEAAKEKLKALRIEMERLEEFEELPATQATDKLSSEAEARKRVLQAEIAAQERRVASLEEALKNLGNTGEDTNDKLKKVTDGAAETAAAASRIVGTTNLVENALSGGGGDDLGRGGRELPRVPGADRPELGGRRELPDELRRIVELFDVSIERARRLQAMAAGAGDAFANSLERAVIEGEKLGDVLDALGRDLARIILRQQLLEPLADAMASGIKPGGGAGGEPQVGGLASFFGSLFGGGTSGGAEPSQRILKHRLAEGGITRGPSLAGEAGPEAVVPLPDGRNIPVDVSGGGASVVVNDMRGADAPAIETSERSSGGKRVLELTIRDTVAEQVNKGELDGPMRNRFGVGVRSRRR